MIIGKMRRRTREISDIGKIEKILNEERICHLAMSVNDQPYVLPIMYVYENNYIYIHCAEVGTKLDFLEKNNRVCIDVESNGATNLVMNSGKPCDWGLEFKSVVAFGKATIVNDREEKIKAFNLLVKKISPDGYIHSEENYVEKKITGSRLIKIKIESMTGKKWNGIK